MSKLVLIDGNAILHRAYHALPPTLTTKKGEPINAVYGFTSMLFRIIEDLKPTHIACTFDRKEPTFRHVEFRDYQAHRPEMDKELSSQFAKVKRVLGAFGIPIFEKAGYEADDLLGSIAEQVQRTKYKEQSKIDEVVIVTGDRDILQLVNDKGGIRVYLPIKGLSNAKIMMEDDVVEKLGVRPKQIPDYKALVGDPSDNYPGVTGIGPKTAVSLLLRYKSKDGIYSHIDEINEKTKIILEKGKEASDLSYKLAIIVTDVPIKFDFNKLIHWSAYNPKVEEVFSDLGFKTLKERAKKVADVTVSKDQLNLI